jgi:hypothetical protein
MKRRLAVGLTALIAMGVMIPSSALAATEFGDTCAANDAQAGPGLFEISAPGNSLPTAAPANGVITKWKVNVIPVPAQIPTALKIVRVTDAGVLIVAEATAVVNGGNNSFDTRLSVQAGDRLGIFGTGEIGTLFCNTGGEEAHIAGFVAGAVGSTNPWEDGDAPIRVPVAAILEPDADNDGYGDETQDGCPQSSAAQAACPLIDLDASAKVGRKAVTVLIAANSEGPVSVKGVVRLGKGKKATLKAKPKTVFPGKIASFRLKFNAKLVKRLKELEPSQKLTLKVTASATNVAGQVSTDKVNTKLKGQA